MICASGWNLPKKRNHDYPILQRLREAISDEDFARLNDQVKRASATKKVTTSDLSKQAELHYLYLSAYSILSRAAHSGVRELDAYLISDLDGEVREIDYAPELDDVTNLLLAGWDFVGLPWAGKPSLCNSTCQVLPICAANSPRPWQMWRATASCFHQLVAVVPPESDGAPRRQTNDTFDGAANIQTGASCLDVERIRNEFNDQRCLQGDQFAGGESRGCRQRPSCGLQAVNPNPMPQPKPKNAFAGRSLLNDVGIKGPVHVVSLRHVCKISHIVLRQMCRVAPDFPFSGLVRGRVV